MRDTDSDWAAIGEHDPFFGVLTEDRFHHDRLDPVALAHFYTSGIADIDYILRTARERIGVPERIGAALDFGSGTGRLTFAMADHAQQVIGVDVSAGMNTTAQQQAEGRGVRNVMFTTELPVGPFDWINSLIVFQHVPPRRGLLLFESLVAALSPGGILTVQLTFFHDRRHVGELLADLDDYTYDGEVVRRIGSDSDAGEGEIRMYDYDLNGVFRILFRHGMGGLWVEHTDHAGCHGVRLFARSPN